MSATITINKNGNTTAIIIKRQGAFKTVQVATSEARKTVVAIIVNLTNMGYRVYDNTGY